MAENSEDSACLSRRKFALSTLAVSAASLLGCGLAPSAEAIPHEGAAFRAASPDTHALDSAVELKLEGIQRSYGSRLNDTQIERLKHVIRQNEQMLAAIHSFPLANGDSSATVVRLVPDPNTPTGKKTT